MRRLHSSAVPGKQVKIKGSATVPIVQLLNANLFTLTTAITGGATTDSVGAVAGDFAVTTHATGRGKLFTSDGTNWVTVGDGSVAPAADVAAIATANAATQSGAYVQADVQSIAALANQLKTTVNAILTNLKATSPPLMS